MKNIKKYLQEFGAEESMVGVFESLSEAIKKISLAVRTADTGKVGTQNSYGEEQVALDVLSNNIMIDELKKNADVGLVASEELPDEQKIGEGEFALAFDPLDGSSLVDVNFSVGTIVGIYKAKSFLGLKGDDQVAALIAVYGPRTTIFLTVKKVAHSARHSALASGVVQFILNAEGEFVLSKENIQVGEGKYFAPGNLRACASREDYMRLVKYWCKEKYTLRYSGGMVPDINHILLKGKGIFAYPGYVDEPNGKLRMLFECAPMSLIMEQAGGASSDGKMRILEKIFESLEQRSPIFIGSKGEVEHCNSVLIS